MSTRLRPVKPEDLNLFYEFQLDPDANALAFTHPRTDAVFRAHWDEALKNTKVCVRAIEYHDDLVGCISCFQSDGQDSIGYWIGKQFWGQGIASESLKLLLQEVLIRPLHARVAVTNIASLRVLQKCGFEEVGREWSPATERFVECEEVALRLQ
ncbi:MAG: GNAT family N-acetyltransferase [Fuerstiella sp.]